MDSKELSQLLLHCAVVSAAVVVIVAFVVAAIVISTVVGVVFNRTLQAKSRIV